MDETGSWMSVVPDPDEHKTYGVDLDGAHYALEGQPPVAVSKGWGNLSFMFWRK